MRCAGIGFEGICSKCGVERRALHIRESSGSCGALQFVDGSQPHLARRVRKAPAMVVRRLVFVGTTRLVSFLDHPAFSGPEGV